ncbi:hypothetical protein LTR56_013461 [Elasticomyces elasticus]|nr:hypothetical protein LTR56_013461 [Elasticomyces elasticus]KAK5753921.1 hypothetical protein LTS12_016013 [Elasticomyces elasticus]
MADKSAVPMETLELEDMKAPRTKVKLVAILLALYLALFIAALDQTIMATSIPTISAQLHSASGYVWIGSAYLLANAAAGPIWAKFSDIWGRKPALLGAVALFAGASIMAALSVSMRMLIAARALQGTAGGGLLQLVFITISDLFSMRERVLYLGLTEVLWAIAGGAGPLIGGAFTELVSWRWCFWINLPICGITFLLLLLFLDVHNPRTGFTEGLAAIDWFGTLSILGVVVMLLLGLDFGGTVFPWKSPTVISLIVFGAAFIVVFVVSEKKLARYPGLYHLKPITLSPSDASQYYLPLYFQSVKQASPLRSGLLILPITVSEGALGIVSGVVMHQSGKYRELMWAGAALILIGTGLYVSIGLETTIAKLVGFMLIGGSGAGLLFEAPVIAIQNTVSQADTATATATVGLLRNIFTAVSIVLGGVVIQNSMSSQSDLLRVSGLNETLIEAFSGGQAAANVELIGTIQDQTARNVVKTAFASSLRNMWIMYTCIAAFGLVAAMFIKQTHLSMEHTETKTGIKQMTERIKE